MRQISNSSTIHTVTSGSENWETYDDASEPEVDASDVYYAKLRAAHGKRLATDDPQKGVMVGKKIKGTRNVGSEEMVEDGGQVLRIHGSDGGWTDDIEPY
jgi:protein regulator of cytokinesis 1